MGKFKRENLQMASKVKVGMIEGRIGDYNIIQYIAYHTNFYDVEGASLD